VYVFVHLCVYTHVYVYVYAYLCMDCGSWYQCFSVWTVSCMRMCFRVHMYAYADAGGMAAADVTQASEQAKSREFLTKHWFKEP